MKQKELEVLRDKAISVLKSNDLGNSTKPAPRLYPHQWKWDSAFIAIGMSHFNEERAQKEIITLLKGQWLNGMIPHIIFNPQAEDYHPGPQFWGSKITNDSPAEIQTSGITQPPILSYAAYQIYRNSQNKDCAKAFLKDVFPKLIKYQRFFFVHRDPFGEGLAYIIHPWESGLDNSPRWDGPMQRMKLEWIPEFKRVDTNLISSTERPSDEEYVKYTYLVELFRGAEYNQKHIWEKSPFAIQAILFNSLMYASLDALKKIAHLLGEDTSEIKSWMLKTKNSIEMKLWDAGSRAYGDFDLVENQIVLTNTVAKFIPLFAGIPSVERAKLIIESMMASDYWPDNGYPLCSVSRWNKKFDPVKYWRGPVWININWLMIRGLQTYGFFKEARDLTKKTIELVQKEGFYEYFHPLTGRGCGASDFSWTASLLIDLLYIYKRELD